MSGRPPARHRRSGKLLGEAIKARRVALGWTRADLATYSSTSENTIAAIELGRVADPGVFTTSALARPLGLVVGDLVDVSSSRPTGIVSIGYEGREISEFVTDLSEREVHTIADVRLNPLSRKPGFSKTGLRNALAAGGINYVHHRSLGNPRDNRDRFRSGAIDQGLTVYRAAIDHEEGRAALEDLAQRCARELVAILCFEQDHERCHRQVVVEAIRQRTQAPLTT